MPHVSVLAVPRVWPEEVSHRGTCVALNARKRAGPVQTTTNRMVKAGCGCGGGGDGGGCGNHNNCCQNSSLIWMIRSHSTP